MNTIIPWLQIVVVVILVVSVLLQQTGAGLGGALGGGSDAGSNFHTRRGPEKVLFYVTIVTGIIFTLLSIMTLFI
ncbi:MAG: protein translocase SecG subunit [Flavobacteriaceae bacterium]|jgi:protein translocase SecG subunit